MKVTIDGAGRIVVPKALRDRLGLTAGTELEIDAVDGRLEITPVPTEFELVETEYGVVARPTKEIPPLTDDLVRETLEQIRR